MCQEATGIKFGPVPQKGKTGHELGLLIGGRRLRQREVSRAQPDAERYVRELYSKLLHREPGAEELEHWIGVVASGMSDREVFHRFADCDEYRVRNSIVPGHPIGHYYSPIVDPAELVSRRPRRDIVPDEIQA